MHQASVGFHCPECAQQGAQKEFRGVASLRARPLVTQVLIGVNVAVYVLTLLTLNVRPFSDGGRFLNAIFGDGGLTADGVLLGGLVPDEPWRLVTSGFLHSDAIPFGFLHIGLNMWVLWILGQFLEPALGRARFLALYVAALMGGALGVVLLSPDARTVGASGAIYGLMGGALLVARERNIDLMRSGLVTTLGLNLVLTFGIPGISIGGHLGGLVLGALAGVILTYGPARLGEKGDLMAAGLTVGLGLVVAVVAFAYMAARYGFAG
jgi:membrane associated rhomboid family serine protease